MIAFLDLHNIIMNVASSLPHGMTKCCKVEDSHHMRRKTSLQYIHYRIISTTYLSNGVEFFGKSECFSQSTFLARHNLNLFVVLGFVAVVNNLDGNMIFILSQ